MALAILRSRQKGRSRQVHQTCQTCQTSQTSQPASQPASQYFVTPIDLIRPGTVWTRSAISAGIRKPPSRSSAGRAKSLPIKWNRLEGAAAITRRESSLSSRFTMWPFPRTREGLQCGRPVPSFSRPVPWSRSGAAAATAQLVPAPHNNDHQSAARRFSSRRRSPHSPSAGALVNCPPHD